MNRKARRASASAARQGRPTDNRDSASESPAAKLHRAVVDAERSLAGTILAKGRAPGNIHEVVDGAAALGGAYMARNPTDPAALACKAGCDFCCHRPVGTTAPVVFRIAAWLREHLTPAELGTVLARVVSLDQITHGVTWTPKDRPPHACAFLVDGRCCVYEVRPLVCRAWNSVDADDCKRALGQDTAEMRFDLFQRTTFAGVEKGMQLAMEDAGLDGADLELTAAIRVALERPDACEAWLAGERVFAGCEAKPPPGARRRLPFAQ
jgi:hypothetical protein